MRIQQHKWPLAVLVLGIFLTVCSMKLAEAGPPLQFGGWVTYWDFKRGMNTALERRAVYRDIFIFSSQLNADGTPFVVASKKLDYSHAIVRLKKAGIKTWMTFVNDVRRNDKEQFLLKDPKIVHNILKDKSSRLKHRREIVALALDYGVGGIDIDYENLLPEDRADFSLFIKELSADLKKRDLSLSVTVQPKTFLMAISGNSPMDWSEICQHTDRLQIMLYNLHNKKTSPGPFATVDWIDEVLKYAKSQCKPGIIVPILKVSGMDWGPDKITAIQYDQAVALKNRHDAKLKRGKTSRVPFFSYKKGDDTGVVFFEDAHSLKIKIDKIISLGFDKIVFWSLGRQDPRLTSELEKFSRTANIKTDSQ